VLSGAFSESCINWKSQRKGLLAFLDGTENGRPLYRERYVGREEETPEVGGDEELRGDGVGHPDGMTT
jgi:hypothetical protein